MKEKKPVGKRILKVILLILLVVLLLFLGLVAVLSVTEYKPEDTEEVQPQGTAEAVLSVGDDVDVLTWNVGYLGLSAEADFFMDGGTKVRAVSEEGVQNNLAGVESVLAELDPDVAFLQEVDVDATRSYHMNEKERIADYMTGYQNTFATNFKCLFVPYPWPPMGQENAGILTESRYEVTSAERIQLTCPFSWPYRLCNLKRCLLVNRVPVEGTDKEFVFVNLHLEAYDSGEGKAAQTQMLADFIQTEYEKGNYVVAGGDFNQSFSNVDTSMYPLQSAEYWEAGALDTEAFTGNWQFLMDTSVPSCRSLDKAYDPEDETFQFYMIDGFIVSDNLTVNEVHTEDTGFAYTDHNPVTLNVTLKE